ncbi:transmembrane protein, putative (macronuclear) [Tetrahymena thermophila SB210]|uniref:Transmembrane protein, putative n=1 Tax=Tetrahymena thermophila (strain SB210) TaxID=312017 RepID=W7XEW0_TETTS|nr:transmembrane protein, putative [Tetrahymena thermophila SB210]EWS76307.1 transmembrane protein, putative [Tetrahymena thermophila SB210]|eukprot:XP_012651091.1 transmembrane protein, putative [Tetrahymena thermophila SB210]
MNLSCLIPHFLVSVFRVYSLARELQIDSRSFLIGAYDFALIFCFTVKEFRFRQSFYTLDLFNLALFYDSLRLSCDFLHLKFYCPYAVCQQSHQDYRLTCRVHLQQDLIQIFIRYFSYHKISFQCPPLLYRGYTLKRCIFQYHPKHYFQHHFLYQLSFFQEHLFPYFLIATRIVALPTHNKLIILLILFNYLKYRKFKFKKLNFDCFVESHELTILNLHFLFLNQ